jgi:hypothetical protein
MEQHVRVRSPGLRPPGPLAAFRTWRIVDGELRSPYDDTVWTAAALTARCSPRIPEDFAREAHVAPSLACGCGVSAATEPNLDVCGVDASSIVGVVRLWGRVVLQAGTLRAQHAQVVMLGAYRPWSRRQRIAAAAVAERLGCPLVALEAIAEEAVETLGRRAFELDPATTEALRARTPAMAQVPGPDARFAHAR